MIKPLAFTSLSAFLFFFPALLAPALSASVEVAQAQVKKVTKENFAKKKSAVKKKTAQRSQNRNKQQKRKRADTTITPLSIEVSTIKIPVLRLPVLAEKYQPQMVTFSGYEAGTIVVDTKNYFLYFVESPSQARRYGIAVGQVGLQFKGSTTIAAKREWPRWIPTADMITRNPAHYARYANGMDGGPGNPLGARALYLSQGNKDTYLRIHGTVQPWTIGTPASNGCFRMMNDHVIELYEKVKLGAEVVIL